MMPRVTGIGVHSGLPVTLTLHPADADTGIVFLRTGIDGEPRPRNPRRRALRHRDRIRHRAGRSDRPAVLDRRARAGGAAAASASTTPSSRSTDPKCRSWTAAPRRSSPRSIRPASSRCRRRAAISRCSSRCASPTASSFGELRPLRRGFRVEIEIDFDHPLIGRQALRDRSSSPTPSAASSRAPAPSASCATSPSCGAPATRSAPRFENTLVVTENRMLNPDGLRFADEFVRHKALDAIGDLALAGAPLLGAYRSVRGGHKLNHAVLSALMADPTAWTMVEDGVADPARARPCRCGGRPGRPGLRPGRLLTCNVRHIPGRLSGISDCPHRNRLELCDFRRAARRVGARTDGGRSALRPVPSWTAACRRRPGGMLARALALAAGARRARRLQQPRQLLRRQGPDRSRRAGRPALQRGRLPAEREASDARAAKKFEEVDRQHPYSEWARKSLIMSAYAYYEAQQYDECDRRRQALHHAASGQPRRGLRAVSDRRVLFRPDSGRHPRPGAHREGDRGARGGVAQISRIPNTPTSARRKIEIGARPARRQGDGRSAATTWRRRTSPARSTASRSWSRSTRPRATSRRR